MQQFNQMFNAKSTDLELNKQTYKKEWNPDLYTTFSRPHDEVPKEFIQSSKINKLIKVSDGGGGVALSTSFHPPPPHHHQRGDHGEGKSLGW
jgi:hypothetical protein